MTPSCPKCEKAYPSPSPKDCDWCGGRLVEASADGEFTTLLDAALHHARASHAVRYRTDPENTKRIHAAADDARKAVIDYFKAATPSLLPVESESGERKQEQENGNG